MIRSTSARWSLLIGAFAIACGGVPGATESAEASEASATDGAGDAGGVCGDGIVDADELCDDADGVEGNGCNADCLPSGRLLDEDVFRPAAGTAVAFDVAVSGDGSTHVVGWSSSSGPALRDAWRRRYDPDRSLLEDMVRPTPPDVGAAHGEAVVTDGDAVTMIGCDDALSGLRSVWLESSSAPAAPGWSAAEPEAAWADVPNTRAVLGVSGALYVVGSVVLDDAWTWVVRRYDPGDGTLGWSVEIPAGGRVTAVAPRPDGGVLLVGNDVFGGGDLVRVDQDGVAVASSRGVPWRPAAVAHGSDGLPIVVGTAREGGADVVVARLDAEDGIARTWTWNGAAGGDDVAVDAAVGTDGSVFVAATSQVDAVNAALVVLRFGPDDGLWWAYTHEAEASAPTALAIDGAGVRVVGRARRPGEPADDALVVWLAL